MGRETRLKARELTKVEAKDVGLVLFRIVSSNDEEKVPDDHGSMIRSFPRSRRVWRW